MGKLRLAGVCPHPLPGMAPMARERHALAVLVLVLALVRSSSGKACGTDIEGAEDVSAVSLQH